MEEIAKRTRNLYQRQHERYLRDQTTYDRFLAMASDESYYELGPGWFEGKTALDAGCGNTAYFDVALQQFGVSHITCLDIGDEWIPTLSTALKERGVPESDVTFVPGSVHELPFPDASFDFVAANGVLQHLVDEQQADQAFAELARVTRPGGVFYLVLGHSGGLFEDALNPAVRTYYAENAAFRQFVDQVTPADFASVIDLVQATLRERTGESVDLQGLKPLFDEDLCTTIQNVVQTPKRLVNALDETWARDHFARHNFPEIKRLRRYVQRKNIRKYMAPLHYTWDNPVSQLLYGTGNQEFLAYKAGA